MSSISRPSSKDPTPVFFDTENNNAYTIRQVHISDQLG